MTASRPPRRLGQRAILLTGHETGNEAGLALGPDMLAASYAPYAALFPRAVANVHQGGIGTTGQAMRAGSLCWWYRTRTISLTMLHGLSALALQKLSGAPPTTNVQLSKPSKTSYRTPNTDRRRQRSGGWRGLKAALRAAADAIELVLAV